MRLKKSSSFAVCATATELCIERMYIFGLPTSLGLLGKHCYGKCCAVPRAEIRRQLWEYDQVLNSQRDKVYAERRRALLARDLSPLMLEYAQRTVDDILEARCIFVKLG